MSCRSWRARKYFDLNLEAPVARDRSSRRARPGNGLPLLESGRGVADVLARPEGVEGGLDGVELAVGLLEGEHLHLGLDGLGGEDVGAGAEVGEVVGRGGPALVLGVAEVGGLVVAEVLQHGDVEGGHHVLVLVDEVVAVEHVEAGPGLVVGLDAHRLADGEPDDVLEAVGLVGLDAAVAARA